MIWYPSNTGSGLLVTAEGNRAQRRARKAAAPRGPRFEQPKSNVPPELKYSFDLTHEQYDKIEENRGEIHRWFNERESSFWTSHRLEESDVCKWLYDVWTLHVRDENMAFEFKMRWG